MLHVPYTGANFEFSQNSYTVLESDGVLENNSGSAYWRDPWSRYHSGNSIWWVNKWFVASNVWVCSFCVTVIINCTCYILLALDVHRLIVSLAHVLWPFFIVVITHGQFSNFTMATKSINTVHTLNDIFHLQFQWIMPCQPTFSHSNVCHQVGPRPHSQLRSLTIYPLKVVSFSHWLCQYQVTIQVLVLYECYDQCYDSW